MRSVIWFDEYAVQFIRMYRVTVDGEHYYPLGGIENDDNEGQFVRPMIEVIPNYNDNVPHERAHVWLSPTSNRDPEWRPFP